MFSLRKLQQQTHLIKEFWENELQDTYQVSIFHDQRPTHTTLPEAAEFSAFAPGQQFSGHDQYYWLKFPVVVPALADGAQYQINVQVLSNQDNGNSIAEGMVFADGMPIQAVDGNHRDIMLDDSYRYQQVTIAICFWTGLGSNTLYPEPVYTYHAIRGGVFDADGYYTWRYLDVMAQTVAEFDDDEPLKYAYLNVMNQVVKLFNFGALGHAAFAENTKQALALIHQFTKAHAGQDKQFNIAAIGHTHIDVAWLWRLQHTREKTGRSFATELSLMKQYPEYVFMHSTPQVYDFVKHDYPQLYEQIKQRVQEGRWEPDGATWLEPDMNIPSGESITRQFLYGGKFFKQEFNAKQTVLWLPDVFGYSAALPQIMLGFDIHNFMTTKISWNDTNHMPHDTFDWEGIDGSKVLTYFITTVDQGDDYKHGDGFFATYNGQLTPHSVLGSYHRYQDKLQNDDLLLSMGYGDGGGGPTREMVENEQIMNELPGLPSVHPTRVDDFFKQLRANFAASGQAVPQWAGELYFEYHRGTYTSQARVKKENRQLEYALRALEIRATEAQVYANVPYPAEKIQALWQIVMRNQFHDILPGSSIHEVYTDNAAEYQQAFAGIKALNADLDQALRGQLETALTVRNDLAWARQAVITVDQPNAGHYETEDGTVLTSVRQGTALIVQTPVVPALSEMTLKFVAGADATDALPAETAGQGVETAQYRVTWDASGVLTSVYDKTNQQEVINSLGGNRLTVYEDRPLDWDNWNIDADYVDKATQLQANQVQVTEYSALRTVVTFTYRFQASTITQQMILTAGSPRIDFDTKVQWHEHHQLLRVAFDTTVQANEATYDIQYGNVRRSTHRNTSWDVAKFETVGHKWGDLSRPDYGVALLNNAKYGYDITEHTLSLSLIKSGQGPDPEADQGTHHFTYSLLPHRGNFVEGGVEQQASELNVPLTQAVGQVADDQQALFAFGADQLPVAVDAIKQSEDGQRVILRLHDYSGACSTLKFKPQFTYQAAALTNLAEVAQQTIAAVDGWFEISLKPYQIVTVAFSR
ncbi:alpha-mannosidase [Lacticaseibacillus jixiensis]|uniref:alpha-mannosidase n=1 Tax=Lacticaseibacillus jixiensis TaxID=3231926 RepID=UPI0036F250E5